jgi:hypothetical protein
MKATLLLAAALTLAAGCASSSGLAMGANDNAQISTRMNTIEAASYRAMLGSDHQFAGLEDKASELEQKALRDAERRKDYRRTVPQ